MPLSSLNVWDVVHNDCVWLTVGGPGHGQQGDVFKTTLLENQLQGDMVEKCQQMTEAGESGV